MTETLASSVAPVIPLPRRVPVPAAGWATPNQCSECFSNHPGQCACWCHFPSQDQVDVLAMVLADMGYGEAFARSQPQEDSVLWLPVGRTLKSWGMP